ncbi:cobyric acid synthase [Nakamurella leprariae]|uniref:Cobyric acid synthase n=1 Tax=Nakamurella leprariae TaxID=2803911 RepID=A0A939C2I5_9ACTN|nr:cobyric acid synthase [Nakamurella leprariae]MBM9468147.1 cobyric acid synthase [Nakamurella leprariae]
MTARGVLVAGTSSDAGKSLITAGLCRVLVRRGLRVAPFKAQNMSNNSMVCADGAEIGRAQVLQAQACRVDPEPAMNPVLLKPGSDRRSFVLVRGRPAGQLGSGEFANGRAHLAAAAWAAYEELAERFDVVVCEGAGSPAEINLRAGDYVNMGLARRFDLPVLLVGDIDRGGVFASLYGTAALLEPEDRALLRGFLINKFRGDPAVLTPGLDRITELTGVPVVGVVPWLSGVWLDGEDTLEVARWRHEDAAATDGAGTDGGVLRVAVVRLPRMSNGTDVDALAAEPGVQVSVTADPAVVAAADLVVLPGTRATISDLAWLHRTGLAGAVHRVAAAGRPVLGLCGGFQMLGRTINDPDGVEVLAGGAGSSADVEVTGLGLLPVDVRFEAAKVQRRSTGTWRGAAVGGYEIHHGRPTVATSDEAFPGGGRVGSVWGTMWHGAFEHDGFRRAWLAEAAAAAGSRWRPDPVAPAFADRREAMIDTVADALEQSVDLAALGDRLGLPVTA